MDKTEKQILQIATGALPPTTKLATIIPPATVPPPPAQLGPTLTYIPELPYPLEVLLNPAGSYDPATGYTIYRDINTGLPL